MAYSEAAKRATIKYTQEKVKRLEIRYTKEEFEQRIEPAVEKSGIPVATFIKEAIEEKIERDQLI